jgi:hypothetical protein
MLVFGLCTSAKKFRESAMFKNVEQLSTSAPTLYYCTKKSADLFYSTSTSSLLENQFDRKKVSGPCILISKSVKKNLRTLK